MTNDVPHIQTRTWALPVHLHPDKGNCSLGIGTMSVARRRMLLHPRFESPIYSDARRTQGQLANWISTLESTSCRAEALRTIRIRWRFFLPEGIDGDNDNHVFEMELVIATTRSIDVNQAFRAYIPSLVVFDA